MSEDYKKIALEDVKKGQRVHINLSHDFPAIASCTGTVIDTYTEWGIISLGSDRNYFQVRLPGSAVADIFLLEDVSEPSPTDMFTDGATYFEYTGTIRFASVEHWRRHEPRLRDKRLKDREGDVWAYLDGQWKYHSHDSYGEKNWYTDLSIEEYVVGGFTIVDDEK